jgi:transglutaminase-like putative cysteine protease
MKRLRIQHRTDYRYAAPVRLGPQRLMMRPRDSHDLDIDATGLVIDPPPAGLRWLHDVWGNSVAIATFTGETDHLTVESRLELNHYGLAAPELVLDPQAEQWPFEYAANERVDLAAYRERLYPETEAIVPRWALKFAKDLGATDTQRILVAMMQAIRDQVSYRRRDEFGVQPPEVTLAKGGTCRDFAVLMMEALRCLGFATRFVSGYLHDTSGEGTGHVGGGSTHAWLDVYLPGAGWVEFDPTNALYGGADLIRVATTRDPVAALPLTGYYIGSASSTMTVNVKVDRLS